MEAQYTSSVVIYKIAIFLHAKYTTALELGQDEQPVVVSTDGGLRLSHKLARGAATRQRLIDAFRAGLPVEGRVEKAIKGGYEVRVAGQRAFCPTDPAVHVGHAYTFRITECKEDGKQLVVSRRALLKEEEEAKAREVRRAIVPDAVLTGRVSTGRLISPRSGR